MAKLPSDNHRETSSFANMWNGSEDEDYRAYLDLQLDDGEADMDPMYKIFLEHLRKDGHSYVLEMADDHHGFPAFVKYEDESESSEEIDIELQRSSKNISHKNERKRNGAKKFAHAEGGPSQEPVEISVSLDSESMFGAACSLVDESYQTFLRHVRFEDLSMILEWESRTVRYEEVNEASNSSEGLTTEDTLCNGEQGLGAKVDDGPIVTCKFSDPSQFRKQLSAILAQPFDQNEYEQLWKDVTDRKPLEKQKELRGKSISYATDQVGMSYLDHHSGK
ncbi:hypothetical protein Taro_014527 [Colocasia esculenta]|uniref:Uncharacterized protein n=1 Tax=Colocasia esculenta TaxID=4460 RepID=A0A843UEU7_COLES|nr:hypothetical protein [Colocasia esculenta]